MLCGEMKGILRLSKLEPIQPLQIDKEGAEITNSPPDRPSKYILALGKAEGTRVVIPFRV